MKNQSLQKAKESLFVERNAIGDIISYLDTERFGKAVDVLISCPKK